MLGQFHRRASYQTDPRDFAAQAYMTARTASQTARKMAGHIAVPWEQKVAAEVAAVTATERAAHYYSGLTTQQRWSATHRGLPLGAVKTLRRTTLTDTARRRYAEDVVAPTPYTPPTRRYTPAPDYPVEEPTQVSSEAYFDVDREPRTEYEFQPPPGEEPGMHTPMSWGSGRDYGYGDKGEAPPGIKKKVDKSNLITYLTIISLTLGIMAFFRG